MILGDARVIAHPKTIGELLPNAHPCQRIENYYISPKKKEKPLPLIAAMDHFERPANPTHPLIQVPLVTTEQFDEGDVPGYLERRGWTEQDISGQTGCTKNLNERAAFMQVWLFFGLLKTIFGRISPCDYIRASESPGPFVTLSKLEENLQRVYASTGCLLVGQARQFSQALETAYSYLTLVVAYGPYKHSLDLICLSIAALGEGLQRFFKLIETPNWLMNPSRDFLTQRMLSDGWCPTETSRLLESSSIQILSFISDLDRPGPLKDHRQCRAARDPIVNAVQHIISGRTDPIQECVAYQTNNNTYQTKHEDNCSSCVDMIADQQELVDILEKRNSIPLIQLGANSQTNRKEISTTNKLHVIPATSKSKYVAISHVWSDGLGNHHQNSLPTCQIVKISNLVRYLYPDENVAFWIDTICVPIRPMEARRKAIMLLIRTYSDADSVLVLDSYIESRDPAALSNKEMWLRVMQCGWTRRLWTLQEGILAKKLYFRCKYSCLDINKLVEYARSTGDRLMTWDWDKLRGSFLHNGATTQDPAEKHSVAMRYLSATVAYRSTSRAEDETLCLAAITGLTPTQIGETYNENGHVNRMKKFWSLQPYLYTECLFWTGPRFEDFPWRWAPSTFLGQGGALFMGSNTGVVNCARLSCEGLCFKAPGMLVGSCTREFHERLKFFLNGQWYHGDSLLGRLPSQITRGCLAIILQEPISALDTPVSASIPILVMNITRTKDSTYFAHPVTTGRIQRASHQFIKVLTGFRIALESQQRPIRPRLELTKDTFGYYEDDLMRIELSGKYIALEAKELNDQQDWCIG